MLSSTGIVIGLLGLLWYMVAGPGTTACLLDASGRGSTHLPSKKPRGAKKKKSAAGRRQSCHGSPNVVPPRSGSCEAKLRHVKLLRSTVTTIWSVRICLGFVKHTVRSCLVFVKLYAPLYNLRYNVSCCFAAFAPSGRRNCSSQRYRKRRLYEFDFGRWDPLARSARRAKPARARWTQSRL